MSDQFIPKIAIPDLGRAGGSSMPPRKRFKLGPITAALLVFFVAFALRAGHNMTLKHQVWLLGDAYNYMFTGNLLLRTVQESGKLQELFSKGTNSSNATPDHLKLASRDLADRISLDGLLYPSYLALAQGMAGVGRGISMEESRLPVCLCNSFLDSVACVFIFFAARVAFGSSIGITAGLLAAVYPPFVINTQQCLSEPLACFFVSLWLLALLCAVKLTGSSVRSDFASYALLGVSSAFLVMAKPTHSLLVLFMAAGFWCGRAVLSKGRKFATLAFVSFAAAAIILFPSMLLTKTITGEWMLSAKRSPFESLALTFNASQDGWRAYPYPGVFPTSMAEMLDLAKKAVSEKDAGELLLIGVKKVSRLWSGVVNDYQYSVLGLGYEAQVFLHRLMLVFAFVGIVILIAQSKGVWSSRRALCGSMLVLTICFHLIYLLFEAMPRYAVTAIPAVIILASYGLVSAYRSALAPAHFFAPAAILCVLLALIQASSQQISTIASLLSVDSASWAPWISAALQSLLVLGILPICVSFLVLGPVNVSRVVTLPNESKKFWSTPLLRWGCLVATAAVSLVVFVCSAYGRDWAEWHCQLKENQGIKQVIRIPLPKRIPSTAMILIDCKSSEIAPPIVANINGSRLLEYPVPLASILPNSINSIVDGLMQAEAAMGCDSRAFRQWWVIPFSVNLLRLGEDNEVVLTSHSESGVTIYGDYGKRKSSDEDVELFPAFWRFSYTKGFCSTERGDPRIMERVLSEGSIGSSALASPNGWISDDLSSDWGVQSGSYRVRIVTSDLREQTAIESHVLTSIPLVAESKVCEVVGGDPRTMSLLDHPMALPAKLSKGTRFEFSCEVHSTSTASDSMVSLIFGKDPGWTSQWQPKCLPVDRLWKRVVFSDVLPEDVLADAEVRLVVYPYQSDLIYTNRKAALASKVEVRKAILRILSPLDLAITEDQKTHLY